MLLFGRTILYQTEKKYKKFIQNNLIQTIGTVLWNVDLNPLQSISCSFILSIGNASINTRPKEWIVPIKNPGNP